MLVIEQTVHGRVAQVARAAPDRIALTDEVGTTSYGALVADAARLAHLLRRRGVRRGSVVGLDLPPGAGLVTAMLATLQAGAAYLPLTGIDAYRYRAELVAESGCALILGSEAAAEVPTVDPAEAVNERAGLSGAPPDVPVHGGDLAYVLHTSGSTGRPKGVLVEHRSIVNLVQAGFARSGPNETYCALAPPTFDATTFEVWGSLCSGAQLALPPSGMLDPFRIADVVERFQITVLYLSKGLFNVVVESVLDRLVGVRQLVVGGDVLSPEHVATALRRLPGTEIGNGYGPTEATTFTLVHRRVSEGDTAESIPVGRPIVGAYVHVLDDALRPMPDGQEGEVFIGGLGVARGYTDPDLTRARFLPDPLAPGTNARVYRTGDRAVRRPDGVLLFRGRRDDQVKIRGFRVELAAVERILAAAPGVRQACAVVRPAPAGERHVVGYVVLETGTTAAGVRAYLRTRLPGHMNPTWLVPVKDLPLAPNGKIDRRQLPDPTDDGAVTQ